MRAIRILTGTVLAAACGAAAFAQQAPPLTARQIEQATEHALRYIRSQQGPDGSMQSDAGTTAFAALTMLAAGASPITDHNLQQALEWLGKRTDNNTYVRAVMANVWNLAVVCNVLAVGLQQVWDAVERKVAAEAAGS